MIPIYRAGGQLVKVRAVMILSLVSLALCLWWGLDLAQTHGLNEGDGGVLASLQERLAMGGLVAALGIAFAVGMWLYGSHYAARIDVDPETSQIHLYTVGFFWNRHHAIKPADFGRGRSHHANNWGNAAAVAALALGQLISVVDAPWKSVRIEGWRLPLIIDQQGVVLHRKMDSFLSAGTRRCDLQAAGCEQPAE